MQTPETPHAANGDNAPPVDDLTREAIHWVIRLTSGEASAQERDAFRRWRDASPDHAAALAEARGQWLALGQGFDGLARRSTRRWSSPTRIGAIAAALVVCVLTGRQAVTHYGHDYVTGAGERRVVQLADGTRMVVGARSAVDVRFTAERRAVTLARGEAYFEVAKAPGRPFAVTAGQADIRDIGTAFEVRRLGDGGQVVVAEGQVRITQKNHSETTDVLANQEAAFGSGASQVRAVDAAKSLGWVNGRLVLVDQSLSEAAREINRYYKGRLVVLRDDADGPRINAVIDLDRIDGWVSALDSAGAAKVSRLGPIVFLR